MVIIKPVDIIKAHPVRLLWMMLHCAYRACTRGGWIKTFTQFRHNYCTNQAQPTNTPPDNHISLCIRKPDRPRAQEGGFLPHTPSKSNPVPLLRYKMCPRSWGRLYFASDTTREARASSAIPSAICPANFNNSISHLSNSSACSSEVHTGGNANSSQ